MVLQKMLPFDYFIVATRLSVAETLTKIEGSIEPRRKFRYLFEIEGVRPYEGKVEGNCFEMTRILPAVNKPLGNDRRNRYLPLVKGKISSVGEKTKILVRIRPALMAWVSMSILLCLTLLICISLFTGMGAYVGSFLPGAGLSKLLFPCGIFGFIYLVFLWEYKTESKKAKLFLAALLESHE